VSLSKPSNHPHPRLPTQTELLPASPLIVIPLCENMKNGYSSILLSSSLCSWKRKHLETRLNDFSKLEFFPKHKKKITKFPPPKKQKNIETDQMKWKIVENQQKRYAFFHILSIKVADVTVPQSTVPMSPRWNWDSSPHSPHKRVCPPPPPEKMGGDDKHSPVCEGVGKSQFRRLERKLNTLRLLCGRSLLWERGDGDSHF
jgi:hypothetical protein